MEKSRNKLLALINEGILYIYFQGTTGLTDEKVNKIVRRIIDIKNLILEYNLYEAIDSLNKCIEKLVNLGKFYKDIKFFDLANAISDSALFWMKGLPGNLKKEDVAKTYALYNATTKVLKNKEELGTTYDFFENVDTEEEAKTIVQNFEKSAIKCIYIPKNDSTNKSFDIYFVRNKNQKKEKIEPLTLISNEYFEITKELDEIEKYENQERKKLEPLINNDKFRVMENGVIAKHTGLINMTEKGEEEVIHYYDENMNPFYSNFTTKEEALKSVKKLSEKGIKAVIGKPVIFWPGSKECVGVYIVSNYKNQENANETNELGASSRGGR